MNEHDKILPQCKIQFDEQKDDIDGLKRSLFGENGLHGVLGYLKNKVSKKGLAAITIPLMAIIALFLIAGLNAWGNAKEERFNNKESISIIQKEFNQIKITMENIEKNQIKPNELLEEIRKIIDGKYHPASNSE